MEWKRINGNSVHDTAIVNWDDIDIGTGNKIYPHCCIGMDAQHVRAQSAGKVRIGNNNTFREFSKVTLPTHHTRETVIENNCYFMQSSLVGHDVHIEDNVILCNGAIVSGHTYVMRGVMLGNNSAVHQYQVLGSYTMMGMGTIISANMKIEPGNVYVGNPAKFLRMNSVGLERNDVSFQDLKIEKDRYEQIKIEMNRHYAK